MRDRPPQRNHPTSFYTMLKKNSNKVSSARFPIFCLNAQDDVPGELPVFLFYGKSFLYYSFILSEKIIQGELWLFNQLADDIEDP